MPDVVNERLFGEHIVMLANDGDVNYQDILAQVVLYEAPADKRAIIKDFRVTPAIIDPNNVDEVSWPASNVTANNIHLKLEKSTLFVTEATSPDLYPKALYMGNFSGAVLPMLVLEPLERLILSWIWNTSSDQTFEIFTLARVSGLEVQV